jgi:hypothetical protein
MSDIRNLELAIKLSGGKYGCDKVNPHQYHKYYAKHLVELINKPAKILEIGIGGEEREIGGASLLMWAEVFPQAQIYAWDIYPKHSLNSERIKTYVLNQNDVDAISVFMKEHGPFDLIIDDGSHFCSDQLTSLFHLIEGLTSSGIYAIEDYFTSYWPLYGGSSTLIDFLDTPVRWIKKTVDIINRNNFVSDELKKTLPDWNIEELHVYPGLAIFQKSANSILSKIPNTEFFENQKELDFLRYGEFIDVALSYATDPMLDLKRLKLIHKALTEEISKLEEGDSVLELLAASKKSCGS